MRVLLVGASGALGRQIHPVLTRAGHDVTGLTRHAGSVSGHRTTEIVADILDRPALLRAVEGQRFDAVIHVATELSREPRRYAHMRTTNRLRTEGTSSLVAAARATGAERFVSASVFYGYGFENFDDRVLDEDAAFGQQPGGPVDAIHRALLSNEQQTRAYGGVALRFGVIYRGRGAIPSVPSDWRGTLPFIHIEDAAAATVAALDGPRGSVFNIVDDTPASWREVHEERARAFELPDPTPLPSWMLRRAQPFRAEFLTATSMRVSNARAKRELDWAPEFPSYREGIWSSVTDAARARPLTPEPSRVSGPSRA